MYHDDNIDLPISDKSFENKDFHNYVLKPAVRNYSPQL